MLAVFDGESGRFLGRAGLKHWPQFDETELGWGFTELDVPYLTAMINAANLRSIRVAERLDLTPVRKDMLLDNPAIVYTIQRA